MEACAATRRPADELPAERALFLLAHALDPGAWDVVGAAVRAVGDDLPAALARALLVAARHTFARGVPGDGPDDAAGRRVRATIAAALARAVALRLGDPDTRGALARLHAGLPEAPERGAAIDRDDAPFAPPAHARLALGLAEVVLADGGPSALDLAGVYARFVAEALRRALRLAPDAFPSLGARHGVPLDTVGVVRVRPGLVWWERGRCVFAGDVRYEAPVRSGDPALLALAAALAAADLPAGLVVHAGPGTPIRHVLRDHRRAILTARLDPALPPAALLAGVAALAACLRGLRAGGPGGLSR